MRSRVPPIASAASGDTRLAAVAMPKVRWGRLIRRIENCKDGVDYFGGISSGAFGVFLATFIPGLTIGDSPATAPAVWFLMCAALSFGSFLGFAIAFRERRAAKAERIGSVLEEMREIEAQFVAAPTKDPTA